MNNEPPENRHPPTRKTPSVGGNIVWYLLGVVVVTLFLVSLMDTGSQVVLNYMDLVKLIEKGRTPSQPPGRHRSSGERGGQRRGGSVFQPGQPHDWSA